MPTVSIFLPSYNHARFLEKSIQSVLQQTYQDFELLIVDDASTDESWEIIQSLQDPRLRAVRNETNQNSKKQLRKFITDQAAGQFIAIHHSDNIWAEDKLAQQVAFLDDRPEFGAVFTHAEVIDEHGHPLEDPANFFYRIFDQPNRTRHAWLNFFFFQANALCHPSALIRKSCFQTCGLYRPGFRQIPDLDLWIRLCMQYEIWIIQEKLVQYRVPTDSSNLSGIRPDSQNRFRFEFLQVLDHYLSIPSYDELVKIFPEAQALDPSAWPDVRYYLGRIALESERSNAIRRLFGLQVLFDLLTHPDAGHLSDTHQKEVREILHQHSGEFEFFADEKLRLQSEQLQSARLRLENKTALIAQQQEKIKSLTSRHEHHRKALSEAKNENIRLTSRLGVQSGTILTLQKRITALQSERDALQSAKQALEQEILNVTNSKSWRITRPLRQIAHFFRRLNKQ